MPTIQKRCIIGSLIMHAFLVLVVLFGAAFFPARKPERDSLPMLRVVPDIFAEGKSGGGGDPNLPKTNEQKMGDPNAKPPQPPTPQVKPVLPKPPEPKAVEPPVKPAVTKPKDQLDLKPAVRKSNTKPETANIKPTKSTAKETAKSKADADARAAGAKLAQQIAKAKEGLQRGFSQGTAINVWGEGGPAYADYAQTVKSIYDDAWIVLPDISLDAGMAVVKVTVARDGRVVRATIIDRSGQRALDLSVQQALDRVTRLPAFPAEAKDDQRTFTIEFDLKAKRSAA